jgi:acetyl esterase/lipase
MEFKADIVYATEDPKQKWDLYTPASLASGNAKAKGVIVFVHGGAWKA